MYNSPQDTAVPNRATYLSCAAQFTLCVWNEYIQRRENAIRMPFHIIFIFYIYKHTFKKNGKRKKKKKPKKNEYNN